MGIKQLSTFQLTAAKTIPNNPEHDKINNPNYFPNSLFDSIAISLSDRTTASKE